MKFSEFFCFDALVPVLESTERDGVIAELVASLEKVGKLGDGNPDEITKAVIERENEASTGMGRGIAIPHVKHSAVDNVVATLGQSPAGIDFAALDKQAVYSVILLISPVDYPDKHLRAMENVFKHLQREKFIKFLKQAETAAAIEDLLREVDDNPAWL